MVRDSRTVLSRSARPADFTVAYGDGEDNLVDVRIPTGGTVTPPGLVIMFHGGFWRQAYDRVHLGPFAEALADAGHVVATPEFARTGGGGAWPTTFDDVAAAVAAVPGLVAARTPVDLGRMVLCGHSAGGHLALWVAAQRPPSRVRAVVALAPVADLKRAYALDLDGGAAAALLGGGPDDVPDRYVYADPLGLVPVGLPITLVHGTRDTIVPVDFSIRFAEAARQAGDDAVALVLDADHFDVIDPLSPAWPTVAEALSQAMLR